MRLFDYEKLSAEMHARDIDVILAGTKPNVEYLTDVEWMRWFDKENFLTEDGENYAASFVGLPRDQKSWTFLRSSIDPNRLSRKLRYVD